MKTSNPYLLAELDTLEEVTRKCSHQLEVVKYIEKLELEVEKLKQEADNNMHWKALEF